MRNTPWAGGAPLVVEWRELRNRAETAGSRVDRARVRLWELETELLRDFLLTMPPENVAVG